MRHGLPFKRPLIGITTGEIQNAARPNDAPSHAQTRYYAEAIKRAGGSAVLIPFMEAPHEADSREELESVWGQMRGIVLAGGNDISPSLSNEELRPTTEEISWARDETELRIVGIAKEHHIPVLAICRGMQLLNVAHGGTLYQHLPYDVPGSEHHLNPGKDPANRHIITVEQSSQLGRILIPDLLETTIYTNSYHHQAVNELGTGLEIVARAADGVIEAIESTDESWFAVGVQWHPESMGLAYSKLFEGFVDVAREPAVPRLAAV